MLEIESVETIALSEMSVLSRLLLRKKATYATSLLYSTSLSVLMPDLVLKVFALLFTPLVAMDMPIVAKEPAPRAPWSPKPSLRRESLPPPDVCPSTA